MKLNNLFLKFLPIAIVIMVSGEAKAETYRAYCTFYGQHQKPAAVGCLVELNSGRLIIRWDDGFTTNLVLRKGDWYSMPSGASAKVSFGADTGRVTHVDIYGGPGKGTITVD